MYNPLIVLAAALLATTAAQPVTTSPQSDVIAALETREPKDLCKNSSFENQSSGGSPKVSDCRQIARNIAGGGQWETTLHIHRQLVSYGTCAFGVTASGTSKQSGAYRVGNQDIIDLINSSIDKFQWNGLVGAKGMMPCQGCCAADDWADVSWGIYHT